MDSKNRTLIVFLSILIHILILYLLQAGWILGVFSAELPERDAAISDPIVFDLQEANQPKPREVIETPDDAKVVEQQKKAKFLSDKNALARNPETDPNLNLGEAFSRGDYNSHDLPRNPGMEGQGKLPPAPKPQEEKKSSSDEKEPKDLDKEGVERSVRDFSDNWEQQKRQVTKPGTQKQLPGIKHDNQQTRARDMGGLSFNTYDWEFAPYLLALKRRIQRNIFPPVAFTHLGLINGETVLRFKIYPSGEMRDLEILGYRGHKSLMETSNNAIMVSAPFPQLPADFPEPYLEVTGRFTYFIHKNQ